MRLLGGILKTFILLAILGFAAYELLYFFPIFSVAPCAKPIPYTLGTFDKKFNISEKTFLGAIKDAEAIWEKPYGKELPDGDFAIFCGTVRTNQIESKVFRMSFIKREATSRNAEIS